MIVTTKRLVEYHISRLQDKNAAMRLKAIQELSLLADPESMEALRLVYENDPDEEVRTAARVAGRAIYRQSRQATDKKQ